jgi:colanic acid biosynthesis protein WcaH
LAIFQRGSKIDLERTILKMLIEEKLYKKIITVLPIPCVDLVVENQKGKILLLKRRNEPAKDQWWFPGGRIHFGELRKEAAVRKLREECGLLSDFFNEIGTYDLILHSFDNQISHAITTVYHCKIESCEGLKIDNQSVAFKWNHINYWINTLEDHFLLENLKKLHDK